MPIPVAVIGVGVVGSAFVHQILSISSPSPYVLVALASSQKLLYNPQGLSFSPAGWKSDLATSRARFDPPSLLQVLRDHHKKGIWVDNTSNEVIAGLYPAVLRAGFSVVTPNKKAFSGDLGLYEQILRECRESRAGGLDGVRCLHESTVGAGLPILSTLKEMVATGDQVIKIEGVFSGTLSYIFNEFSQPTEGGPTFSSVVAKARELGYTEPHPGDDLNGADVARKLTILSRLIPALASALPDGYKSVQTTSLVPSKLAGVQSGDEFVKRMPDFDAKFEQMRSEAAKEGQVLRFVGIVDVVKKEIKADLQRYPSTHPFCTSLGGSDNIIAFHTARYSPRPLIIQGAGAGADVTAMGVLGDAFKLIGL